MRDLDEKITATVTKSGRITIPKALRDALGWNAGHKLDISINSDGEVVITEFAPSEARQKVFAEAIARIVERQEKLNLDCLTLCCLTDDEH